MGRVGASFKPPLTMSKSVSRLTSLLLLPFCFSFRPFVATYGSTASMAKMSLFPSNQRGHRRPRHVLILVVTKDRN